MKRKDITILLVAVLVLTGIVVFMNSSKHRDADLQSEMLYPGLVENINDIRQLRITQGDQVTTIARSDTGWLVVERDGFPADADKILEIVLAIAEARTLEKKTADPERHVQLGVEEPIGENGVAISIFGDEFEYSLIVGNTAQTRYRYVRKAGDPQSWLIDRNPAIPEEIADWLQNDVVDIGAERIESVTISHADGETITISKESEDNSNYDVADIPEGRELSYPAAANGIAAVLGGLAFDDVRRSSTANETSTSTRFVTRDGLEVNVESAVDATEDGEVTWFSLGAAGADTEEAAAINAATNGWQYRLPDHKSDLLVRRWEDLLKSPEE